MQNRYHLLVPISVILASSMFFAKPMTFKMSVQAWTFNRFSAFEAIEKTSAAGASNIELYPGQKIEPSKEGGIGPDMTAAQLSALKAQLSKFKVQPVAFGVTGIDKDYNKARPLFLWAKSLGISIINTESTESLDTIEKLVKEFDIKVGFHNHPRQEKNPNYKVWNPEYIYSIVKDRDVRIGACADTGHWVRSGIKPVDALKVLKGRVVSSHLKDLDVFKPEGHDMPYGKGVSDISGILKMYDRMKLEGSVSVEYEFNWDNNLSEVAQCIGFVRGFFGN
jgi:sugar phosphate isomerase/epimerase